METSPSDDDLVRAVREGDARAFETLYERYRDWVVALAFRFVRNEADALDVLQETFAYLLRKARGLELRSRMKTFLYPVVKHLSLSRGESARRIQPLKDADPPAPAASPSEVEALLEGLSDVQREVVLMRFVDGLDLQGIADALEVPLGTVKSRLHSALEILRRRNFPNR